MAYDPEFRKAFRVKLVGLSDSELNSLLAHAIGWELEQRVVDRKGRVYLKTPGAVLVVFNYMDWHTIGPIAERYDLFPSRYTSNKPQERWLSDSHSHGAPTPQAAIAFAMIELAAFNGG